MPEISPRDQVYGFGDFVLYADGPLLLRDGVRVPVTPRVLNVLLVLVENAGRVVTKETLLNRVWSDSFVEEGNLNRTVSRLRKTLGDTPDDNRFVETVPRVGYRFVAEVRLADSLADPRPPLAQISSPATAAERSLLTKWPIAAAAFSLIVIGLVTVWLYLPRGKQAEGAETKPPKHTPIRLTNNPTREERPAFTTDGRIRFVRWVGDRPANFVMNADGSDVRQDTTISGIRTGSWSPDGRKVVFYKDGDESGALYLADGDGSNEIKLPFMAGNMEWAADGSKLVYQFGPNDSEIFIYTLASNAVTDLIINPGFDSDPSFSPDGKSVLFVSDRDGNAEIYIKDLYESTPRRLTNHPAHDEFPTFSPDGTQIVFNSNREDENFDVYLMNVDGTGLKRLTTWKSDEEIRPGCWSPDGTKIAIASTKDGKPNVYVMEVEPFSPAAILEDAAKDFVSATYSPDGMSLIYVSRAEDKSGELFIRDLDKREDRFLLGSESSDMSPRVAPDGGSIALQTRINGNAEVCLISIAGGDLRNLTDSPTRDADPAWSPDGSRIAFVSNRDGNYDIFNLYIMNADGSNQHRIYFSNAVSHHPSWSPDGVWITFSNDKEDGRSGNFEIFAIQPETVNPERRLTRRPRYDIQPVFSPDGKRIAFTSNTDGNMEIYLMNADGSGLIRVTRDRGDDSSPSWSPDGKTIIFSSNRSGRYAIYEVPVD